MAKVGTLGQFMKEIKAGLSLQGNLCNEWILYVGCICNGQYCFFFYTI